MTFIKRLIGQGLTDNMRLAGADLGMMRYDKKRGCIAALLGDNFSEPNLQGEWRGPSVILFNEDYSPCGIPTVAGPGKWPACGVNKPIQSLWNIQHDSDPLPIVLPTDFIQVNGIWIVSVIVGEEPLTPKRTEFHSSVNLATFNPDPLFVIDHEPANSHPGKVMLTFEAGNDGYLFIFGTGGLQRDQPIWLWRTKSEAFPQGDWEPFGHDESGWGWGTPNENTPVLEGKFGELNLRQVEDSYVLSFFDAQNYCASMVQIKNIEDVVYSPEKVVIAYGEAPSHKLLDTPVTVLECLYGPMISPLSKLSDMKLFVSQWNTATNDPYGISLVSSTFPECSKGE